jgi:hypothetical protein
VQKLEKANNGYSRFIFASKHYLAFQSPGGLWAQELSDFRNMSRNANCTTQATKNVSVSPDPNDFTPSMRRKSRNLFLFMSKSSLLGEGTGWISKLAYPTRGVDRDF